MVLGGLDETPIDTKTKKTNVLLANIFNSETMIYTRNALIPKALERWAHSDHWLTTILKVHWTNVVIHLVKFQNCSKPVITVCPPF